MKNLVLKQYSRLKISDTLSAVFGLIGITCGTLSIIALQEPWKSETASSILTICSLIFDILSTFMAVMAFMFSKVIRDIKTVDKIHIRKRERIGGSLDFASFICGVLGLISGWISLIALFDFWGDDYASIVATAISVTLDFFSFIFVVGAIFVIESIHNKYFTNEPTRGIKVRISRRQNKIKSKKRDM